jgi:hypothetical protein
MWITDEFINRPSLFFNSAQFRNIMLRDDIMDGFIGTIFIHLLSILLLATYMKEILLSRLIFEFG